MQDEPLYWGLKTYEWLTLVAIVVGPILAILVSKLSSDRDKVRDQRLHVLRMLIATHHLPSDPGYQVAINLIPVEFRGCSAVITAHREFIQSVYRKLDGVNDEEIQRDWGIKSIRLVHEVAKVLKFDLRETDLQTISYSSGGWSERERVLIDSQKAMRDVANLLHVQSRLLAQAELTDVERNYLGLQQQKPNSKKS